jgi:hypothetical protein
MEENFEKEPHGKFPPPVRRELYERDANPHIKTLSGQSSIRPFAMLGYIQPQVLFGG